MFKNILCIDLTYDFDPKNIFKHSYIIVIWPPVSCNTNILNVIIIKRTFLKILLKLYSQNIS